MGEERFRDSGRASLNDRHAREERGNDRSRNLFCGYAAGCSHAAAMTNFISLGFASSDGGYLRGARRAHVSRDGARGLGAQPLYRRVSNPFVTIGAARAGHSGFPRRGGLNLGLGLRSKHQLRGAFTVGQGKRRSQQAERCDCEAGNEKRAGESFQCFHIRSIHVVRF
jgi:hypothetical protein